MDIMGPCRSGAVLVENFIPSDGRLLGILAVPKPDGQTLAVRGKRHFWILQIPWKTVLCTFDLPEGAYRLLSYLPPEPGAEEIII